MTSVTPSHESTTPSSQTLFWPVALARTLVPTATEKAGLAIANEVSVFGGGTLGIEFVVVLVATSVERGANGGATTVIVPGYRGSTVMLLIVTASLHTAR
jgi:hypothetical protein